MSFLDRLLSKPRQPDPKVLRESYEQARSLASKARWRMTEKCVQMLAAGADPTMHVRLDAFASPTSAVLEALQQNQPQIVDAILEAGHRLSDYEVQKVVRAVEQQPDFDGHPGELPDTHEMIRTLYRHGERFKAPMGDPRFPEQTQADFIRRHAPSLSDLDFNTPAFGAGLDHRAAQPVATTAKERQSLAISLGAYSERVDEVRELLRRGADPMNLVNSLAPTTLVGKAIYQANVPVFMVALEHGLKPSSQDLRDIVSRLMDESDRPVELFGTPPHHKMIRILFDRGERFTTLVDDANPAQGTLAERIQRCSPTLARDLDWSSPAPRLPASEGSADRPRRRGP